MVIDVLRSDIYKIAMTILLVCLVLAILAVTTDAISGQRIVNQPQVQKTAPVNQPVQPGLGRIGQPTINPTIIATIHPTIILTPTPMPTWRRAPISVPSIAPAFPG